MANYLTLILCTVISMPSFEDIRIARNRIAPYIQKTPILESNLLNKCLGSRILFKAECMQLTGSFKIRGAINTLAKLSEQGQLPERVVANSSGNHAQAIAYACNLFNLPAKIFSSANVSAVKAAATRYYGAELALYPTRTEADAAVREAADQPRTLWIPPFNHPDVITGQGTLMLDASEQVGEVDAVFAPCGGGGLLSGTLLSARGLSSKTEVIGAEPLAANDAAESLRSGKIVSLKSAPDTLADGAATPSVGEHTFPILKQLDHFYEINEEHIAYWTQWLQHLLKIHVEPTCAMTMQAVVRWLATMPAEQKILVMLTGGNIDNQKMLQIWQHDWLTKMPSIA